MAEDTPFQNATAQPFIATFAWIHDLRPALHQELNPRLARELDALTAPRPPLEPGRNWQTEQTLHELEEFAAW